MEQTFITKLAMVMLAVIVFVLLMGFYGQFQKLLIDDKTMQENRDKEIRDVFVEAHAKLLTLIFLDLEKDGAWK